jgi:hypothetical protein
VTRETIRRFKKKDVSNLNPTLKPVSDDLRGAVSEKIINKFLLSY